MTAEPEAGLEVDLLRSAIRNCRFIRETSVNDFEDEYAFKSGSLLTVKVSLVLSDPPYSTRRGRGQSSCAHDVFSKKEMKDAVRLLGSVMAPGAQGHVFCSDLMSHH